MSDFEKIFQTRNPIEFDFIAGILEDDSVEFFLEENTGIFDATSLQQITVRSEAAPGALRAIAKALIETDLPDEPTESDDDLAAGLQLLNKAEKERVNSLDPESSGSLWQVFARIVLRR